MTNSKQVKLEDRHRWSKMPIESNYLFLKFRCEKCGCVSKAEHEQPMEYWWPDGRVFRSWHRVPPCRTYAAR